MSNDPKSEFEKGAEEKEVSIFREVYDLLRKNKKWWLVPILVALALVGVIVILGATKAAPFIYTLF
jgi:hypothetical protein